MNFFFQRIGLNKKKLSNRLLGLAFKNQGNTMCNYEHFTELLINFLLYLFGTGMELSSVEDL